jgi:hypothetical protein
MERKFNLHNGDRINFGWLHEQQFTGTIVARTIEVSDLVLYVVRQTEDRPVDRDFECITVPEWTIRFVIDT